MRQHVERLQVQCPSGFRVEAVSHDYGTLDPARPVGVFDGEVIVVTFVSDVTASMSSPVSEGPSEGPDDSDSDSDQSPTGQPGNGPAILGVGPYTIVDLDAGTGGSAADVSGLPFEGRRVQISSCNVWSWFRGHFAHEDPPSGLPWGSISSSMQLVAGHSTAGMIRTTFRARHAPVTITVAILQLLAAMVLATACLLAFVRRFWLPCAFLLLVSSVEGVQMPASAHQKTAVHSVCRSEAEVRRVIPTPCRTDLRFPQGPSTHPVPPLADRTGVEAMPLVSQTSRTPVRKVQISLLDTVTDAGFRPVLEWPNAMRRCAPDPTAAAILGEDLDKPLAFGSTPLGFTPRQLHLLFQPAFFSLSPRQCLDRLAPSMRGTFAALLQDKGFDLPFAHVCFTDDSFVPKETCQDHLCGWSCVFFDRQQQTCDVIAGTIPAWAQGKDAEKSAFRAECWALIAALWVGTSALRGKPLTIFSDCQAALAIAQGEAAIHSGGVAKILGHVAGCCKDVADSGPFFVYVPGHRGVMGNEFADIVAKGAAQGDNFNLLSWQISHDPGWWSVHGALWSWAGVVCRWSKGDDALPSPLAGSLTDGRPLGEPVPTAAVLPFMPPIVEGRENDSPGNIHLRMVSYNALSLMAGKHQREDEGFAYKPAKPALLAQQLLDAGIHCAAIQEARTSVGALHSANFFRFCSGACSGHLGVELWFRKHHKLISFDDTTRQSVSFEQSSFVVLAKDPRRLVVLFKQGWCQIVFASLHAPHRGHNPDEIQAWWDQTEQLLHRASRGRLLVVGADCNASVGSVESSSVSSCGAEEQDFPGELLHAMAQKCELWLPATWDSVQQGATWTFVQRRNGALTRPDYVLIPLTWNRGKITTWTDPNITAGNLVLDHVATVVNVQSRTCLRAAIARPSRPAINVAAMADPVNRERLEKVLQAAPRPLWQVSAHEHAAEITAYLQSSLAREFPRDTRKPLHPYLSDIAWDLQKTVAWLRRKLVGVKEAIRRNTLLAVFVGWRKGGRDAAGTSGWLREAQVAEALYGFRLGAFSKALRARCKADRAAYMGNLADAIETNQPNAFTAAHRLLSRRRKKPFAPAVLPCIENEDGTVCATPEATIARWRRHFGALEAGKEVTPTRLAADVAHLKAWPMPTELAVMPSSLDLRNALLSAKRGKACGPDAIPGELGLVSAGSMQNILYPLLLKLGLLGEEAVGYKGGALTWIYKGRGSHASCASFRGILLLSTLCKAIHRAFRPSIQAHFETTASPLQIGGRRGGSVVFGSHAMRLFMRLRAAEGLPSVVLFADVSAAYYSTVRSLASRMPKEEPSESAEPDWPAQVCAELSVEAQLLQPSAMASSGASPWLRALTTAINSGTWYCLQGDATPIATKLGTRPGSAWADLSFAVVMRRVMQLRDECRKACAEACRPFQVAWDGCRDWQPSKTPVCSVPLDDLIWADDISECLAIDKAHDVAKTLGLEAGFLSDAFASHALDLSFGPRKTAAIASLRGPGSRAASRQLYGGRAELNVLREFQGAVALPLIETYKHLGVLQARDGAIKPELLQRRSSAWTAFREGRTRLFRCRRVSTKRRGVFLNSLVLSKLLFGAGAWPPLRAGEHKVFAGAVFGLYRATLGLRPFEDQHVSLATMCSLLGLPDHATLLRVEQLRYCKQLCQCAPDAVWALIRQDVAYLDLLRDALAWLFARVKATCQLPHPLENWEAWTTLIRERPALFKGQKESSKLESRVMPLFKRSIVPCTCKAWVDRCRMTMTPFDSRMRA